MKTVLMTIVLAGATSTSFAQTPAPTDPSGASTSHQRNVTGNSDQESMPAMGGTGPADASSPHQRESLRANDGATVSPSDFVTKAALGGMTEVQASQLALQKAQSDGVKKFAQQMVTDHTKANTELKSIASKENIAAPTQLDSDHDAIVKGLNGKSGASFDTMYITQMTAGHDEAIALFSAARGSQDAAIAAFAAKTLPTLQMHRQMLSTLQSSSHASNFAN